METELQSVHVYAEWALLEALRGGDVSARGLLKAFRERAPGRAPSRVRLGPTVELCEHMAPPGMELPGVFVLQGGIVPRGLYVDNAVMAKDGNAFVGAAFVPAGAAAAADIETIFNGEVAQSQAGRSLLAALERDAPPGPCGRDRRGIISDIFAMHHDNIHRAHLYVRDHAERLRAGVGRAGAKPASSAATRSAAESPSPSPLLKLGRAERAPWVASFPGNGHLIVAGSPEFTARFVTLDGTFDDSWPEWVSPDTLFRPFDAEADPRLADRWQQATDRRLDAEVGAAFAEAAQFAAADARASSTVH